MKTFQIRMFACAYAGGAHCSFLGTVRAEHYQTAMRLAREGKIDNWVLTDKWDTAPKKYKTYVYNGILRNGKTQPQPMRHFGR